MVNTIKFSQFNPVNLNDSTNQMVGFGSGANYQGSKVISWSTATRPSSPYNGLIGLNTSLEQYEFWNTNTSSWVQLTSTSSTFTWNNATFLTEIMIANNGYVANNVGQVVLSLPLVASFGSIIRVAGLGSGGWKIVFNPGQNAVFGNIVATTTTGSIASTNQFDQIELLCVVANTTFVALSAIGNLTII